MALIEKLQSFIALSRPTQIIKHTTIFVALILSQWVSHLVYWQQTFFGFLALWLTGACAYAINDLFDAKLDAANPRTKDRPIASNKISKSEAIWFIRLTAIASVALAYSISIPFLIITVAILANTTIYTLYLKKIPYLEMASIATNFVLRVVSGCYIIFEQGQFLMQPTHWLIWMPFLYSIYFVLVKRTLEKKQHSNRYVLQFYSEKKLHIYTFIVTTLVTISYFIYSFYATHTFFWITLPFFTLLLFHVSRIIISNRNEHILNTRCKLLITLYGLSLLCAVHILPKMLL